VLLLLLGALALVPLESLHAQGVAASRIRAEVLARDLEYLSSDALLGRNTFPPGFDSAAAYIARRLAQAGLKPLGDGGGFYQYYEVVEEEVDTAGAFIEIGGRRFPFGTGFVLLSLAGELDGELEAVRVGHGWVVPDRGIDPYSGIDLKGKLALVEGPLSPPPELGIRRIGRVFPGARSPVWAARERGALALLVLPDSGSLAGWDRLRVSNLARFELDPPVPSAYAAPPLSSLLLSPEAAAALLAGESRGRGAPVVLGKKVRVRVPLSLRRVHRGYNVVALLEGRDPVLKGEYVTVESHLDGAVGRASLAGDSIYNAADDNASGSAATLAIAEEMAAVGPARRSVIFIWDSGEERGLWGTRWFVHRPPVPLDRIVAHFNVDMIGASRAPGYPDSATATVTGPDEVYLIGPQVLSPRLDSLVVAVNRSHLDLKLNRAYDREESEFFYPRTDAGPFLERGIPTIGFFTGLHDRYHGPGDEARYLDPRKMERIARTIFAVVRAVADWDERPRIERFPGTVPRYR
jgi:hypothetical protein